MHESVSSGCSDRRSRGKTFRNIHQAQVQNAGRQSQVSQTTASPETAKRAASQRPDVLRTQRTVGSPKVSFRQITEAVTQRQLSPLPSNLLIEIQLLQRLEALSRQVVIARATNVIESQVEIAPQPFQSHAAQPPGYRGDAAAPRNTARVRFRRFTERRSQLQVTQRRRVRLERGQVQAREWRILAEGSRRIVLTIGGYRLRLSALRSLPGCGRCGTVLSPRSAQRAGHHAKSPEGLKFAHAFLTGPPPCRQASA